MSGLGDMGAEYQAPNEAVLESIRARAFARLTPDKAASTHLGLVSRVYPEGHVLSLVDRQIEVPSNSVLVFEDLMPGANFGHPCRYHFHSPDDGRLLQVDQALFPPEVADSAAAVEEFHAPLELPTQRPVLYEKFIWKKLIPWIVNDNRYALLFTSQISYRRHVEDVELAYRVLHHRYGIPTDNIYVLCYDGTVGATDATAEEMATWIGDGTAYEMQVTASATKENLKANLAEINKRMNSSSQLFIHTNNHGSPNGLCIDNSSVVTPEEWGAMLDTMKPFGSLAVTMEQCYSGAFLQPTLDHSKAGCTSFASAVPADKVSWGAEHFDPWAQAWFEAVNGATAYGASLPHQPDTDGNGRVSLREAFEYSKAYDTDPRDDPQYGERPIGCGAGVYLTKPPILSDIVKLIAEKYVLIDKTLAKHPIPDPPPEWSSHLIASLSSAEALAERLDVVAREEERAPARASAVSEG